MQKKIIQFIIFVLVCGAVYGVLSYHFVFYGRNVELLPKESLTFEYTFVNVKPTEFRTPEKILRDQVLRDAGVGDVMVQFGIITDEERNRIEQKIDSE